MPEARKLGIEAARQRVAMPVIPGIMAERAGAHVEAKVEFGRQCRRVWAGRRQARSEGFLAFVNHGGYSEITVQTVGWTTVYPIGSIDFVEFCKMKISCILRFDQ